MGDWKEYFWGAVVTDKDEFDRREEMYQAFKARFLSEQGEGDDRR